MRALSPHRGWILSALLVGIGLAASTYLTGRALDLAAAHTPGAPDLCSRLFGASCDATLGDSRSWILRVPLAGWGVVYFTALGGLLFLARFTRAFEAEALLAALSINLLGLTAGLALTARQIAAHSPLCPLCLSVHAVSLLLLAALRGAGTRSVAEQVAALRDAAKWLVRSGAGMSERARWNLVGFACVALLAAVAYQWIYVESALRLPAEARPPSRAEIIAGFRGAPRTALPVAAEDPHLGDLEAPVRLVVFESFRCAACRRLAATLSRLHEQFGDRLVVVYKHYPLSKQCNERLAQDMQPGACEIAWAAEAANRQERFWQFHDAIFAAGVDGSPGAIAEVARRVNLDPARFLADRASDSTMARVAADIALGDRLKIPGTPAVFVDGRLVSSPDARVLETLIRYELGQAEGFRISSTHGGRGPRRTAARESRTAPSAVRIASSPFQ